MRKRLIGWLFLIIPIFINMGCQNKLSHEGQPIVKKFQKPVSLSTLPSIRPVNVAEYKKQIALIKRASSQLYEKHAPVYEAIDQWLMNPKGQREAQTTHLKYYPLRGMDNQGNTRLTSYYTPILKARAKPDTHFRYPLYKYPGFNGEALPTRSEIYAGALNGKGLEIGYSSSILDNFFMQVQGSAYVDFEDGSPLHYFAFGGKNGYAYQSIGRLLVEQGEISKQDISMQAIKKWAANVEEGALMQLLKRNDSFVFFAPKSFTPVIGSAKVPLVAKTGVATDNQVIPIGTVLLVEMPLLTQQGKFMGQREWRLMVALDTGSAIRGHHLDIYQGIGQQAGEMAGYYNHFGRVWQFSLDTANTITMN